MRKKTIMTKKQRVTKIILLVNYNNVNIEASCCSGVRCLNHAYKANPQQ